jgi:hypothetical protein
MAGRMVRRAAASLAKKKAPGVARVSGGVTKPGQTPAQRAAAARKKDTRTREARRRAKAGGGGGTGRRAKAAPARRRSGTGRSR